MNLLDMDDKDRNAVDDALKNALRRQAAPEGFTDQVLGRVAQQNSTPKLPRHDPWLRFFTQPLVRWAALAAVAAAMILGVHVYDVHRERAEGEAAKQRLMLALRVAGSKLQLAKSKVNELNAN
jgi:UDP-N-acetylmuramyl pentapeptide synthase